MRTIAPKYSLYNDSEWGSLFVYPSKGFVEAGPNNRTFALSGVHQLHCLDVIRVGYVTNRTEFRHHIEHCLHYLMQVIKCNADATLEPTWLVDLNGEQSVGSSEIGTVHRCRDWRVLEQYMRDRPYAEPGSSPM